jgi:hypothetical protein
MTRALLAALLALALLGGWRASLLHPLEHVDEHGRFVHLTGTDGGDARGENDREDGNPSDRLGDSLAALAACAGQVQVFSADPRPDYRIPSYPLRAPRLADAPPFLSHGPPAPV